MTYGQNPSFPPPPPPPPAGGQPMPAGQPKIEATRALQIAWRHYAHQLAPWMLSQLVLLAVGFVVIIIMAVVAATTTKRPASGSSGYGTTEVPTSELFVGGLFYVIMLIIGLFFFVNCYRNAVRTVQGESVSVGDFFKVAGIGKPLGMSVLYILVVVVGLALCIIPGIFAAIAFVFVPVIAIMNPQLGVADTFRHSYEAMKTNPGQIILAGVLVGLINLVASFAVIGGLFVAPLGYLVVTVLYCVAAQRPFVAL